MKTLLIAILFLPVMGNAQQCIWGKPGVNLQQVEPNNIVTDAAGNSYVAGFFNGPSLVFGGITLTSSDTFAGNLFVVKYDAAGNVLWAKNFVDTLGDYAYSKFSIALDQPGNNIYLFGTFSSASMTFGSITLTNTNGNDNFLVKLNSSGATLWAKNQQVAAQLSPGDNQAMAVATDGAGDVVVTGYFSRSMTIGTTTLTNSFLTGDDVFVAKYDTSGNVLWARCSVAANNGFGPTAITADPSGNIYVGGNYSSATIAFDGLTLTDVGGTDFFLVKYSGSGNAIWAKSVVDSQASDIRRLTTDAAGNVYAVGEFYDGVITFGSTVLANYGAGGGDIPNIFLVKYDPSGNVTWARVAGGATGDFGYALATDASGNSYVGGVLTSIPATFGTKTVSVRGAYIAKYNAAGNIVWVKNAASANTSVVLSIARDGVGNLYATGDLLGNDLVFDAVTLAPPSLLVGDMFTAKFNDLEEGVTNVGANEQDILIYPNPATSQLSISRPDAAKGAYTVVTIINIAGQTVHTESMLWQQETETISTAGLLPGLYQVTVQDENGNVLCSKEVVKK